MTAKEYYKSTRMVETRNWTLEMTLNFAEEYAEALRKDAVIGSFNDIKIEDVWTAYSRIKADKGHLLNKSTEWNNAYQEGFEACFEWLKNYR